MHLDLRSLRSRLAHFFQPRSRRILLGVFLVLIALRIALPHALRPILVSQADQALAGRIELADLDLALTRGGVALHGLEIHAGERPAPGTAEPAPLFEAERLWAQISWLALLTKTLRIEELELDGFALRLDRTSDGLVLPQLAAREGPAEGVAEAPEPQPETDAEPSGWSLAADAIALRNGALTFTDHTLGGEPERFDLAIREIAADELAFEIDPSGREPGHVVVNAQIGEGAIGLDSKVAWTGAGPSAASRLTLRNLPVGGVYVYVKDLGWSDLAARLDAEIEHHFESEARHEIAGRVALSDVRLQVEDLSRPALAWDRFEILAERIDLVNSHAAIAAVSLEGGRIVVDPRLQPPLLALRPRDLAPDVAAARAATTNDDTAAQATAPVDVTPNGDGSTAETGIATESARSTDSPEGTSASENDGAKPWSWEIAEVDLESAMIELGSDAPLTLALAAEARGLSSVPGHRSTVKLHLARPADAAEANGGKTKDGTEKDDPIPADRLELAGSLAIAPLAFDGELSIASFALPPLLARLDAPQLRVLRSGAARADLEIALTPAADAAAIAPSPTQLALQGKIGLAGLEVAGDAADELGATWTDLEIEIGQLRIDDVLGARADIEPQQITARLDRIRLVAPSLRLTRTPQGIALPASARADRPTPVGVPESTAEGELDSGTDSTPNHVDPTTTPADPSADPSATAAAADADADASRAAHAANASTAGNTADAEASVAENAAAKEASSAQRAQPRIAIEIAELRVDDARATLADRSVTPPYETRIERFDLRAGGLRWPERSFEALDAKLIGLDGATLDVRAAFTEGTTRLEAKLVGLSLPPLNPYVSNTGFSVSGGALSFDTRAQLGAGDYDSSTSLRIRELGIGGAQGESLFQETFGIPLSMAIGLLTDVNGEIALTVPVAGDRAGTRVGLTRIVGQALRKALVGALTSPLKLLGAVTTDGKVERLSPQPAAFDPGSTEPNDDGRTRIGQIAGLLRASPNISLQLRGATSDADLVLLREAALLDTLREESGLRALGRLGEIRTRRAVREHLEAKASGLDAPLDEQQQAWLEAERDEQRIDPEQLRALANERAQLVQQALIDEGIAAERVPLGDPRIDPPASQSSVQFELLEREPRAGAPAQPASRARGAF